MNKRELKIKRKLYLIIEQGYAQSVPTETIIDKIMVVHREDLLRHWALALYGVQTFTDPMQPRGISPFRRLKAADEYINKELHDIATELKQLTGSEAV
jgi:hypothetical protein